MESLYEREISELISRLRSALTDFKFDDEEKQVTQSLQTLRSDLKKLTLTVKQLEAEARINQNSTVKKVLQERVRGFKKDVKNLDAEINVLEEKTNRKSLLSKPGSLSEVEAEHRERLVKMNEKLNQGTQSLEKSHQVMQDLEESANDVSNQLKQNRETLMSAHQKLKRSSTLAGQARSLLSRMENRQVRQKVAIYGVSGLVGFILLFLLYTSIF